MPSKNISSLRNGTIRGISAPDSEASVSSFACGMLRSWHTFWMTGDGRFNSFDEPAGLPAPRRTAIVLPYPARFESVSLGLVVVPDEINGAAHPVRQRSRFVPQTVLQHDRRVLIAFFKSEREVLFGIKSPNQASEVTSYPASPDRPIQAGLSPDKQVSHRKNVNRNRAPTTCRSGFPDQPLPHRVTSSIDPMLRGVPGISMRR